MGAAGAIGGWFEPSDEVGRAWDEAEAILRASDDLDAVMATIHDADSPVEARRALKREFGFTGRQAALLLTLPVMSFTRSERDRLAGGRRARLELLADVTGVLPAIPAEVAAPEVAAPEVPAESPAPSTTGPVPDGPAADGVWSAEFDGALARISSAMDRAWDGTGAPAAAPAGDFPDAGRDAGDDAGSDCSAEPVVDDTVSPVVDHLSAYGELAEWADSPPRPVRRSVEGEQAAAEVLDEQIGELCDALAELVQVTAPAPAVAAVDDPRRSDGPSGVLLDGCDVGDDTGLRTLLWHLRRTGLDAVQGLFPFAEPLPAERGFDVQAARYAEAMGAGTLGFEPGGSATWSGRLWPIAERSGFGYAVSYRSGPDAGSVWAYGGGEALHRLWDSVLDLLVELYQAFTTGAPCDAAIAAVVPGRVVWSNLG